MNEDSIILPFELLDKENLYKVKKDVKEAIDQFSQPVMNKWVTTQFKDIELSQGSIIKNVPFYFFGSESDNLEINVSKTDAIVLSNSCDVTRRENIILAPLFPFDKSKQSTDTLQSFKQNRKFSILYFPDKNSEDYYINFDYIYNLDLKILKKLLNEEKAIKKYELTMQGYYLMITKLTIFFSRPESDDVKRILD